MKKILILATVLIATPAFATDDFSCEEDILQPAVSPRGTCHIFDTRCEVPSSWKLVSDCEEVADPNYGSRPEDVANRRLSSNYWNRYKAKIAAKNEEGKDIGFSAYKKIGRASWGRAGRDRDSISSKEKDRRDRRTITNTAYRPSNAFLLSDPRREENDKNGLKKRATSRSRTRLAIGNGAVREGKLQVKPKWSVTSSDRSRRMTSDKNMQGWRERIAGDRRIKRKPHVYEGVQLKKTYRPSYSGSLDKALLDLDE